jgi:hypothetical protein
VADDPPTEVSPELAAMIERLALELSDRPAFEDHARQLQWVIDVLVLRGHLTEGHREMIKRIRAQRRPLTILGNSDPAPDPDIDCANRLAQCKARCCSYTVWLTEDEVRAGTVAWEIHEPYRLPKNEATGYCANLACEGGCAVYAHRPRTCRKYDCRNDPRVWIDFDNRIAAPMPPGVIPLGDWPADNDDGA